MPLTLVNTITNNDSRNLLINSAFDFWQRGTGDLTLDTTAKYLADRWAMNTSTGLTEARRVVDAPADVGPKYAFEYDCAASVTIQFTHIITQRLEANDSRALSNKKMILSYYFKSSVGGTVSNSGRMQIADSEDNFATTTVVKTLSETEVIADGTWQRVVREIDLTGINVDNGFSVSIEVAAGDIGTGSFRITGAMLHEGLQPVSFKRAGANSQEELAMCQRYFQVLKKESTNHAFLTGKCFTTTDASFPTRHIQTMRVVPIVSVNGTIGDFRVQNAGTGDEFATAISSTGSTHSSQIIFTVASGLIVGNATQLRTTVTTSQLEFEAEL